MHHPFFEEWKAQEEARTLEQVGRHAWKSSVAEPSLAEPSFAERCGDRVWRLRLRFASLQVCVSFRWRGQLDR
ncbi:hypothetical protein FE782_06120 [Paenibacillus antri]|uniref:Uncharacterized protein n=1 Tax=Paenibacillus antri TaxID=2582848 RepID=A0A5R9GM27_9BACL|nr:hypothetical protein [Paenibacillus antri]TLS52945.1 hypothetical protein FE782_06120 [Paenibacillus antri]